MFIKIDSEYLNVNYIASFKIDKDKVCIIFPNFDVLWYQFIKFNPSIKIEFQEKLERLFESVGRNNSQLVSNILDLTEYLGTVR